MIDTIDDTLAKILDVEDVAHDRDDRWLRILDVGELRSVAALLIQAAERGEAINRAAATTDAPKGQL